MGHRQAKSIELLSVYCLLSRRTISAVLVIPDRRVHADCTRSFAIVRSNLLQARFGFAMLPWRSFSFIATNSVVDFDFHYFTLARRVHRIIENIIQITLHRASPSSMANKYLRDLLAFAVFDSLFVCVCTSAPMRHWPFHDSFHIVFHHYHVISCAISDS